MRPSSTTTGATGTRIVVGAVVEAVVAAIDELRRENDTAVGERNGGTQIHIHNTWR